MKVLLSWLRDFVDVPGTPEDIGRRMSLCGLALEGLEPAPPGVLPPGRSDEGPDAVMDFDVTANRADCLSALGIAREVATAYDLPLRVPGPNAAGHLRTPELKAVTSDLVTVTIDEPELCARYAAGVADVRMGPSPPWIEARLQAVGVRSISNVVDITNYVLLELGHPMHAFDLARLAGPAIVVRRARANETLKTLDGKQRSLSEDVLVIADAARASAIGGVIGGADSEVRSETQRIVLESAWFKPQSIRATSKRLGLRTEASYRFERGADRTAAVRAMARASALLQIAGAGQGTGRVIDAYPVPFAPAVLTLSDADIGALLGVHVPAADVERILSALGFVARTLGSWHAATPEAAVPMAAAGVAWQVDVPGWRVDVTRPVDLIEEIGRHFGFAHLPATFPGVEQAPPASDPRIGRDARVRRALLAMGFSEAVTFAFIERSAAAPFLDGQRPVELANPLSEKFTTLRPSLIPGLIDAVSHNRRRERRDVRLFEIGTRFTAAGEQRAAAVVWTGLATPDHWSGGQRDVDFFDVKGTVEQLCALMTMTPSFEPAEVGSLVPGRTAAVRVDGVHVGVVGQLHPAVAEARDVPRGDLIYVAEVDLDALVARQPLGARRVVPLPRHPSVVRDISILVDDTLSAEAVRGTIRAAAPATLSSVHEFDRYQGQGIPEGKVSLSLRLTFQAPERTLTDEEVADAMERIAHALAEKVGAIRR